MYSKFKQSTSSSASADYRADIDGLRAVAVLSVLFYHAFPGHFPGGFVGVDIFFVISGFLISGILFKDLERDRFGFLDFYARRIRRLFPALILVCMACLIFGWISLLPNEFRQLGKHVLGGSAFSANIVLALESGYFDTDAASKPLRHLWSLGVEEQYYLIWPGLLFLCRHSRRSTVALIAALGVSSFAFNLYFTNADQAMAYYLPLTRFWELMVGSGLAYLVRHRGVSAGILGRWNSLEQQPKFAAKVAGAKALLGTAAIAMALLLINEHRAFPGWWAALVCAGAALIIWAGSETWINRRILASRPLVWIGLISYPLYLWHWPLLSFGNIMSGLGGYPSTGYRVVALAASVALAYLTYRFLELPIRHGKTSVQRRSNTQELVYIMAAVAFVGALADLRFIQPVSAAQPQIAKITAAMNDWQPVEDATIPGNVKGTVLFLGDSHMEQYWPRIQQVARQSPFRKTIVFHTPEGCTPIPGLDRRANPCAQLVADGFALAAESRVDTVVIASKWYNLSYYKDYYRSGDSDAGSIDPLAQKNRWVFDQFSAAIRRLRQRGKRVVVLLSSPIGDAFNPSQMVDRSGLVPHARKASAVPRADLENMLAAVDGRIRAAAESAGAEILDPKDWYCDRSICPVLDSTGEPISRDGSHLRASFVRSRPTGLDVLIQPTTIAPLARNGNGSRH
ncbi:MAG TPA: acyltransferase family protein [Steroidobacteraceae bacterium]|nr:acyltransferase family protein [Steroidobacteraceae bacterium]